MNFVNNWSQSIGLAAATTAAPLSLPDGTYVLTITQDVGNPDAPFEIVRANVEDGAATLTRAQEGTFAQEWPEGSTVYCSLTAATLGEIMRRLDEGGGASHRYIDVSCSGASWDLEANPAKITAVVLYADSEDTVGLDILSQLDAPGPYHPVFYNYGTYIEVTSRILIDLTPILMQMPDWQGRAIVSISMADLQSGYSSTRLTLLSSYAPWTVIESDVTYSGGVYTFTFAL